MPASVTASLSVSHFINSVGAKAGFASIIGLAVLVLLYFAHARETASLRDQLAEAAQRIAGLESRLSQLRSTPPAAASPASGQTAAPGRPVPAPAGPRPAAAAVLPGQSRVSRVTPSPVSAAAAAAAGAGVGAAAASAEGAHAQGTALADPPLAPAGVGAPPLSDATRLIPAGGPEVERAAQEASPAEPTPAPVPAGNGGGTRSQPTIAPPPRVRIGSAAPAQSGRRPTVAPPRQPPSDSSRGRTILFGVIGLLVVAAIAVVLIVATSSGGSSNSASTTAAQTSNAPVAHRRRSRAKAAAFNPSTVTVAVLNGTPTAGRAHRVAVKLQGSGYKLGRVATATDQTHTATVVGYLPGFHTDAVHVAAALKLGPAAAAPIDPSTQALACPAGSPCTVVVTVGSDLTTIP